MGEQVNWAKLYAENVKLGMVPGQGRRDLKTQRLVVLREKRLLEKPRANEPLVVYSVSAWLVEDVLSGEEYTLTLDDISRQSFNDMEVLAWASR